jgi:hypothetical protein
MISETIIHAIFRKCQSFLKSPGSTTRLTGRKTPGKLLFAGIILFAAWDLNAADKGFTGEADIQSSYANIDHEKNYNLIPGISAGYYWPFIGTETKYTFNPKLILSPAVNPEICLPKNKNIHVRANELDAKVVVTPLEELKITGGVEFARGGSDYSDKGLNAKVNLDFDLISISGAFSRHKTEFLYDRIKNIGTITLESESRNPSAEIDFNLNTSISFSLGYNYYQVSSTIFKGTYHKHSYRAGVMLFALDPVVISGGFTYGHDVNDYNIYQIDTGIDFSINRRLTLYLQYTFSCKDFGGNTDAGFTGLENHPLLKHYIESSFKSYYSNIVTFGISCKL